MESKAALRIRYADQLQRHRDEMAAWKESYRPGEPYSGIKALFNGDLHLIQSGWAPREDWIVISSSEVVYEPAKTRPDAPVARQKEVPLCEHVFILSSTNSGTELFRCVKPKGHTKVEHAAQGRFPEWFNGRWRTGDPCDGTRRR